MDMLRAAAMIAVLAGAVGSFGLMLRVGQGNNSKVLLALFTIWVLSPFVAAGWAHAVSNRWAAVTQATLYSVILVVALGSLIIYGGVAFGPPRAKPAAVFLMVPLVSWLLLGVVVPVAAVVGGRSRQGR
jgi:hypothetical protein